MFFCGVPHSSVIWYTTRKVIVEKELCYVPKILRLIAVNYLRRNKYKERTLSATPVVSTRALCSGTPY